MVVQFSREWLVAVLLVATRISPLVFFSPLFSLSKVPARISVVLIMVLSAGIASLVDLRGVLGLESSLGLLVAVLQEVVIGLVLTFGVHAAFAVFSFGGRILDMQMGFGVAATVDPASGAQSPLLGTAILVTAVIVFFLADFHHVFVKALIQSFHQIPPGSGIWNIDGAAVIKQFGLMFSLGLILVVPVIVMLLLLDVALALAARSMPQINMFMLSIPIKIVVGLVLLALLARTFGSMFEEVFRSIFEYWGAVV